MNIKLNGKPHALDAAISIGALAEALGLKPGEAAIEKNREIVPKSAWGTAMLAEGDEVEIVRFIGGG